MGDKRDERRAVKEVFGFARVTLGAKSGSMAWVPEDGGLQFVWRVELGRSDMLPWGNAVKRFGPLQTQ